MRALRNFKPDRCYHLISRIANRAFYLTDAERTRFVDLRAALGIRSANFFTARYLSPLEKTGLIRISGKADRFSPHKLFELTARGRRLANCLIFASAEGGDSERMRVCDGRAGPGVRLGTRPDSAGHESVG